jgi:hypothetical protein
VLVITEGRGVVATEEAERHVVPGEPRRLPSRLTRAPRTRPQRPKPSTTSRLPAPACRLPADYPRATRPPPTIGVPGKAWAPRSRAASGFPARVKSALSAAIGSARGA